MPRVLAPRPSPRNPFQARPSHSPRAAGPRSPRGDAACLPRQHLLGAKQLPTTLPPAATASAKPPGAFAKEKRHGMPKATVAAEVDGGSAGSAGVCSPMTSLRQ